MAPTHESRASSGPLANLRIIEFATLVACPSVGTYLSDFGAEVIKIEQPADGDPTRSMGEAVGEMSAWWLVLGRNKRSVTLDLKHARGREALLRLVEGADVLVESFRPGVLERLDLSPDTGSGIVSVETRGFNQDGELVCTFEGSILVPMRGHRGAARCV